VIEKLNRSKDEMKSKGMHTNKTKVLVSGRCPCGVCGRNSRYSIL